MNTSDALLVAYSLLIVSCTAPPNSAWTGYHQYQPPTAVTQEQKKLDELNALWKTNRIAVHGFKPALENYPAKDVLNYWTYQGGAQMASFTWWLNGQSDSFYSPSIIVDLHDPDVKIYGLHHEDAWFFNPTGVYQTVNGNCAKIRDLLVNSKHIGYDKGNDWDWKVSKSLQPKDGIHQDNLLSAKLRLRLCQLSYVDKEYNDMTFEKLRPYENWKSLDSVSGYQAKLRGLTHVTDKQESKDFTDKKHLTDVFAHQFKLKNCQLNEMVLSFNIESIKAIIYPDGVQYGAVIANAKAMKAALKDRGINVPILTFKGNKIIKSPADADKSWAEGPENPVVPIPQSITPEYQMPCQYHGMGAGCNKGVNCKNSHKKHDLEMCLLGLFHNDQQLVHEALNVQMYSNPGLAIEWITAHQSEQAEEEFVPQSCKFKMDEDEVTDDPSGDGNESDDPVPHVIGGTSGKKSKSSDDEYIGNGGGGGNHGKGSNRSSCATIVFVIVFSVLFV